jgi:ribonuclease P protein component
MKLACLPLTLVRRSFGPGAPGRREGPHGRAAIVGGLEMTDNAAREPGEPRLQALPRRLRMRRRRDFERAYAEGVRVRGSTLAIVARPNGLLHPRFGLSIGRAVWRRAVQRNRVRRIFREAFRLERQALPAGLDLVLMAARPKLRPRLDETRAELVQLARKAARRLAERERRAEQSPEPSPKP